MLSDEDIAEFEVLRDVAMATIFGFLYMGCTLAPREEKNTTEPSMSGGDAALCQITLTSCLHLFCDVWFLLSFFLLCGEMLPSTLRPLVGPMRNPTSPKRVKIAVRLLQASKKHTSAYEYLHN